MAVLIAAVSGPVVGRSAPAGAAEVAIGFGKSVLLGASATPPTSMQFGPDGRLYLLKQDGMIDIYQIVRDAPNSYSVTATQTISLVKTIPNHDDDGSLNTSIGQRQATGMLVTGTASSPVIYVSSSDPRFGGGARGDLNLDTNSGMVSRLNPTANGWQKTDLVRGLPRSEENHAVNGLALDAAANTLYLAVGGHTNMGGTSHVFASLPEYALSAAILRINLTAIGNTTYDLPTLDDPSRPGVNDPSDPFGGNDGANQAIIVSGGPVQVHSSGYRNPYDVVISSKGLMYTADNGHNAGQGDVPIGEGPVGTCTNGLSEPGITDVDSLHRVTPGYYGGHPNPTRGNRANTFNGQSPVPTANPLECDYRARVAGQGQVLDTDPSSSNGLTEYTASNFGGAMKGDLLVAAWDNYIVRVDLNDTGQQSLGASTLINNVGVHPLDIISTGDNGPFPGTLWVADHGNNTIYVFEPNDFGGGGTTCDPTYSLAIDGDLDGYSNADEIDNATDPCSSADRPHDWDGDLISDLNDSDDDNDGQNDSTDPFAIDPSNAMTTNFPVSYPFDDSQNFGGLLNLGFTGLMTNRTTNYRALYDPQKLTAGGAPGVLTVDALPAGDTTSNNLGYGFQFGVRPTSATGPWVAHTRLVSPFAGTTPTGAQNMGLALGPGDQDNYVKVVLTANNGAPGVQVVKEVGGVVTRYAVAPLTLPGPATVDLLLQVNPGTSTVQAFRAVGTGARQAVGAAVPIPATWIGGQAGVAVGVVGSSASGGTLSASWDMIQARQVTRPDATIKTAGDATPLGDNIYNTTGAGQLRGITTGPGIAKTFTIQVGNDASSADTFTLKGPGTANGFTVKYLKGTTGTTDITSAVLAGTYSTGSINTGAKATIRMVVTVTTSVAPQTGRSLLVTATSKRDTTVKDAVIGRVTRSKAG